MIYSLPIDSSLIKGIQEDDIIDMSDLRFPPEITNKQRAALLFIRNTGIKTNFVFYDCTFDEKEKFLLLYLTGKRIDVNMDILASTWVKILVYNKLDTNTKSILTDKEISLFCKQHKEIINEIYRFLVSIPLCAIDVFNRGRIKNNEETIDLGIEYEKTDYYRINPFTFIKIFDYNEIIILSQMLEGYITPVFYTNYFESCRDEHYPGFINDLMDKFPYLSLLNVIYNENPLVPELFVDGLKDLLNINNE